MKIKRIEHVAVSVRNVPESARRLSAIFGLDVEYEETIGDIRLAMLPIGETYLELLDGVSRETETGRYMPPGGEGLFHLCFEVEDIDGALAELKEKGVRLFDETARIGHGGCRVAFLDPADTDGMLIELAEMPTTGQSPDRPISVG